MGHVQQRRVSSISEKVLKVTSDWKARHLGNAGAGDGRSGNAYANTSRVEI
jgi:hypothetical protein